MGDLVLLETARSFYPMQAYTADKTNKKTNINCKKVAATVRLF